MPEAVAAPATVSGVSSAIIHWDLESWEGTETTRPRARRPAVSVVMRGHVGRGVLTLVEPNVRVAVW